MLRLKRSLAVYPLLFAIMLSSCAGKSPGASSGAGEASIPLAEQTAAGEETPLRKPNPGCRVDLPALIMTEDSPADSFHRWTAQDLDGNMVTEEILGGSRLTLFIAWSTYACSNIQDLTVLQGILDDYSREDLNVVGIVASAQKTDGSLSEGDVEIARQIEELAQSRFLQLLPSNDLIAIKLKDLRLVPMVFLVDSQGNEVGETLIGGGSEETYRAMIEKQLLRSKYGDAP